MIKQYELKDHMLISDMVLSYLLALIFVDRKLLTHPQFNLFIYLCFTCARVIRMVNGLSALCPIRPV